MNMTANQGSTTMRNMPDVALTAENVYVRADGVDYSVGGTSCAAPLWAGFTALINQQAVAQRQVDGRLRQPGHLCDWQRVQLHGRLPRHYHGQ